MHPRNVYREAPDFQLLAESYPSLSAYLKGNSIDFYDDAAQRCLTQALLKRDFDLELALPPDRLCPPVPNRLNYVLWIQDIVATHEAAFLAMDHERTRKVIVRGLDIGTGASAIYPLLACTLKPEWTFIATELDQDSYESAVTNIENNSLSSRIHLVKVNAIGVTDDLLPGNGELSRPFLFDELFERFHAQNSFHDPDIFPNHQDAPQCKSRTEELEVQFTMCNPPFYSSVEDMSHSASGKDEDPFGACTGASVEMITPGGEAAFVCAMVSESFGITTTGTKGERGTQTEANQETKKRRRVDGNHALASSSEDVHNRTGLGVQASTTIGLRRNRNVSRWYTSMLGKLSSVHDVVTTIKELGITNYAITEFVQGQTRRWAVGWSLGPWRLFDEISRPTHPNFTLAKMLPPKNVLIFPVEIDRQCRMSSRTSWIRRIKRVLKDIGGISVHPAIPFEIGKDTARDHNSKLSDTVTSWGPADDQNCLISAVRDTWSRRARRKEKRELTINDGEVQELAMICHASVRSTVATAGGEIDELVFRWVYGWDRTLFESFVGHVAGKASKTEGVDDGPP